MITRTGRVSSTSAGRVQIHIETTTTCAACERGQGCGALDLLGLFRNRDSQTLDLRLADFSGCRIGDTVAVSISEVNLLKLSMMAYVVPIIGLIVGAWAGMRFAPTSIGEIGSIAAGVLGFVVTLPLLRLIERHLPRRDRSGVCAMHIETAAGPHSYRLD